VAGPADVAVIGGGIVGTAAAGFLAGGGARVTLYEGEALAAGASGRNSGVVQQPFDAVLAPLYEETLRIYRRLAEETGQRVVALDAPPAGLLLVSHHLPLVRALAADLAARYPALRAEVVQGAGLRSLEPSIAPDVVACRLELGYPIVPSAPTYAFASLAERRGVTIRLGHEARPAVRDGRCVGVETEGRLEPADAVIVAAGPWTPGLVDPTGRWRPIRPGWGVVVETLLPNPPRHVLEEAEMDEALGTGELADRAGVEAPEAAQSSEPAETPEFSLITAAGASAVGSTFLDAEPDPAAWTERLLERGTTFVPGLLDAPIREVRACARPVSLDGRTLVGAVPWIENLFVASGHGPWGISTGPASARQVADAVLGRAVAIDEACSPGRFGDPTRPVEARV
jgi:glycine/D-amino acid oxidase-like deaminating enzyme